MGKNRWLLLIAVTVLHACVATPTQACCINTPPRFIQTALSWENALFLYINTQIYTKLILYLTVYTLIPTFGGRNMRQHVRPLCIWSHQDAAIKSILRPSENASTGRCQTCERKQEQKSKSRLLLLFIQVTKSLLGHFTPNVSPFSSTTYHSEVVKKEGPQTQ